MTGINGDISNNGMWKLKMFSSKYENQQTDSIFDFGMLQVAHLVTKIP